MTATNDDLLYKIIDTKVIDYAELVVCLFDHCNLRCVFCPQDHELLEGASEKEILSKEDLTQTLRAFQNSVDEMKSEDRDDARVFYARKRREAAV